MHERDRPLILSTQNF